MDGQEMVKPADSFLTFACAICGAKRKLPKNEKPIFTETKCCDNPDYKLEILGNNGKKVLISYGQYLSYKNNKFIKIDDEGREVLDIFEEKDEEKDLKEVVLTKIASKKPREATEIIVDVFKKTNHIYTTRDDERSEMWVYSDGIYISEGKTFVREFCREMLGEAYTGHLANEVIGKIEADTFIDKEQFFKNNHVYEIPILDGVLDIRTRKITPFTPSKIFFSKLPLNYKPQQKCPKINKFFKDVLAHPEDIKVMHEVLGLLLVQEYRIEKAIMLNGYGRNGKGKTLRLFERFVGDQNCCNVGLSSMRKDNFDLEDLFGKLVNLAGDTGKTALKDTGCFKELVGRDGVNLPRKFKRTIRFVNHAKHIFACNELPIVYDDTDGFWTKWVLLDYPYKFITEKEYNRLPDEDKVNKKIIDVGIIDKISTQDELNGLLNEALDGFDRLIEQNDFSYTQGTDEIKRMWKRKASSFTAFCEDCVLEDYDSKVLKRFLKKKYFDYCKKYKLLNKASDKTIKYLLENNFSVEEKRESSLEGQKFFWEGIKLKEESTDGISQGFEGEKPKKDVSQGSQGRQGFQSPIGTKSLPRGSKKVSTLTTLSKGKIPDICRICGGKHGKGDFVDGDGFICKLCITKTKSGVENNPKC